MSRRPRAPPQKGQEGEKGAQAQAQKQTQEGEQLQFVPEQPKARLVLAGCADIHVTPAPLRCMASTAKHSRLQQLRAIFVICSIRSTAAT
jgi:hypothetical protein